MWLWLGGFPVGLFLLVFGMTRLENRLIGPLDRADRINTWLVSEPPDAMEKKVEALLSSVVRPRVL